MRVNTPMMNGTASNRARNSALAEGYLSVAPPASVMRIPLSTPSTRNKSPIGLLCWVLSGPKQGQAMLRTRSRLDTTRNARNIAETTGPAITAGAKTTQTPANHSSAMMSQATPAVRLAAMPSFSKKPRSAPRLDIFRMAAAMKSGESKSRAAEAASTRSSGISVTSYPS